MMMKKTLNMTFLASCLLLGACTSQGLKEENSLSEDVVLPVTEINRMIAEYRKKAADNPTTENFATLNKLLTIQQKNQAREAAEAKAKAAIPKYGEKYKQVSRDYTLDWDNYGRGGAAVRQPAYVHTLAGENNIGPVTELNGSFDSNAVKVFPASAIDQSLKAGLKIAESNDKGNISYSIYEMSRWERYCNHGKGMDKRDWAFVREQGLNNVPSHMRAKCNPPH